MGPVKSSADLERILALPRRPVIDLKSPEALALVEMMTERLSRGPRKCACTHRHLDTLLPIQAWALYEAPLAGGLFGSIAVGAGKSILDILMPMVMPRCKSAVLLIPPGLKTQLWREYLDLHEHFYVPSIRFDDGRGKIITGRPVLHVLPYSKLSRPEATDILTKLAPDLIIGDELHKLSHFQTATVRRFLRYLISNPDCRFCGWSGTVTKKSIKDYAHLAAISLGDSSPLPLEPQVVDEWSTALDPSDWPAPMGAIRKLAVSNRQESVHEIFHGRLTETLGMVSTTSGSVDASINIFERKPPPMPKNLQGMLDDLRTGWIRPDGEELVEITEKIKCAKELACGFYYRWRFPKGTNVQLIDEWFLARRAWHRELRAELEHAQEHLDSPKLLSNAAERAYTGYKGPLPIWRADSWKAWNAIKDRITYDVEPVWVSDYLAEDAAAWADSHFGPIWYDYVAFGARIAEISGLRLHGGGPDAEKNIQAERGDQSIVVSIKAHGTGRDGLQKLFNEQLVANFPSSGDLAEQLFGRLHRIGQTADEVNSWIYRETPEMRQAVDRALCQAKYIQGTLGQNQKLLAATCDFEIEES